MSPDEGTRVFRATGHLTGVVAVTLCKDIEQLRNSSCGLIVLDLTSVNLVDSVALGGLIYTRKLLEKSGKRFVLRGVQGVVRGLLRDCSLEELIEEHQA